MILVKYFEKSDSASMSSAHSSNSPHIILRRHQWHLWELAWTMADIPVLWAHVRNIYIKVSKQANTLGWNTEVSSSPASYSVVTFSQSHQRPTSLSAGFQVRVAYIKILNNRYCCHLPFRKRFGSYNWRLCLVSHRLHESEITHTQQVDAGRNCVASSYLLDPNWMSACAKWTQMFNVRKRKEKTD